MNRILLADDSPHAQRMGERILRDEGYEVVSVTDGETAILRMADVDPDLILADVFLPGKSGLDLCSYIRTEPAHHHVRIVLTAGMLEPFDEDHARAAGADAIIKKPFEASVVLETIRPLVTAAAAGKSGASPGEDGPLAPPLPPEPVRAEAPARPLKPAVELKPAAVTPALARPTVPESAPSRLATPVVEFRPAAETKREAGPATVPEPELDTLPAGTGVSEEELLRAAVTLALDAAFPALVEDITTKVLRNLRAANGDTAVRDDDTAGFPAAPFLNDLT